MGKVSVCKTERIQIRAGEIDAGESRSTKKGRREGVAEVCGGASAMVVPVEFFPETMVKPEWVPSVDARIVDTIRSKSGRHCGLEFGAEEVDSGKVTMASPIVAEKVLGRGGTERVKDFLHVHPRCLPPLAMLVRPRPHREPPVE